MRNSGGWYWPLGGGGEKWPFYFIEHHTQKKLTITVLIQENDKHTGHANCKENVFIQTQNHFLLM